MSLHTTHAIFFLLMFMSTLPFVASGEEMVSEEYRVYGYGVGNVEGQVLTSEQYMLTPTLGGGYIYGDSDESLPPRHGSRSRTVTTTPEARVTDVIGGVIEIPRGGVTFSQHISRVGIQENRDTTNTSEYEEGDVLVPVNTVSETEKGNRQSASLINALRENAGNMHAFLSDTFKERSARVVLFIFILVLLYVVRTHTLIGKKYRPF